LCPVGACPDVAYRDSLGAARRIANVGGTHRSPHTITAVEQRTTQSRANEATGPGDKNDGTPGGLRQRRYLNHTVRLT